MTTTDPMVAALLRERESYVRSGKPGRVRQVTEALAARGYTDPPAEEVAEAGTEPPAEPPAKDGPDTKPPQGRRATPRQSTT